MSLSRRDFVKLCTGTVAGIGVSQMFHPAVKEVFAQSLASGRPPVFWAQGQGCTGCSVTLLNNVHPGIAEVLLKIISLEYHPTVMAGEGAMAYDYMMSRAEEQKGAYIYAVEGAIPVNYDGKCCVVAEKDHKEINMMHLTDELAANAAAVLAIGTCASFGGVPASKGNETGAMGVSAYLKMRGINTPVINISGCPPHPDWIVGTVALGLQALTSGTLGLFAKTQLDAYGRPKAFYKNVHMHCPHLTSYETGKMCSTMTDKDGCRFSLGCKGPWSACDSSTRKWNNGVNWCVNSATCIGCTSPNFPDGKSPFYSN